MPSLAYTYLAASATAHDRSTSVGPAASSPNADGKSTSLNRARSTSDLDAMAAANGADDPLHDVSFRTINDPRHASTSDLSRTASLSPRPGDASDELSALNDKLIRAIEHSNSLEEKVTDTRRDLEASRARIAQLEAEAREWEEWRSKGVAKAAKAGYLSPRDADQLRKKAQAELDEERKQKAVALQEKRSIELELETLTASLFDEANKMVAAANEQKAAVEKKNQQLRDQIKDGEAVIASQTEQLTELKTLMMQINADAGADLESPRVSLAPSTPDVRRADVDLARLLEAMNLSPVSADHAEILPSPATSLTHLVRLSCRTDVLAYDDFKSLLATVNPRSHNPSHTPSRAGSGSYAGIATGLGLLSNNSSPNLVNNVPKSSETAAPKPSQASSHLPDQFSPSSDQKSPASVKDTRFFKRLIAEDIEPTLRLDLSTSISWLNRRAILAALADSTLLVEPIPEASQKLYGMYTPCAMCGEARKSGQNPRTHAMRVHEGESATKWPICGLCLEKVRAVCDLIAYIKMIREGIVKCADTKEEDDTWEELIRMRERLFWARMAGGVSERDAHEQLERNLADATTFDNANEKLRPTATGTTTPLQTPPSTPPRGRIGDKGSGSRFPTITIPKLPDGFWQGTVNTLH
ncbi:hypothetical protein DV736_g2255, partial [Chaetothyriales sp. CBS 134916]